MNVVQTCSSALDCSVKQLMNDNPEFLSAVIGILIVGLVVYSLTIRMKRKKQ